MPPSKRQGKTPNAAKRTPHRTYQGAMKAGREAAKHHEKAKKAADAIEAGRTRARQNKRSK